MAFHLGLEGSGSKLILSGGVMLIRLPNGTVEGINFRETCPSKANVTEYILNPDNLINGAKAIATP